MNQSFFPLAAAALLSLGVAGCESTGNLASRAQERPAAYAALKPWERKYIEKGTVAVGFTPDMVYLALGHPTKIDPKDFPAGHAELWTYRRSYPNADALRGFGHATLSVESAFQPQRAAGPPPISKYKATKDAFAENVPLGEDPSPNQSISKTGGPQGGSMEPADLPSYTLQVLFTDGQVARLAAVPNTN